jgi:hypothetical protein
MAQLNLATVIQSTHVPRASAEWDVNRRVICDSLHPLVQPTVGVVNMRVGSPQRFIPLSQERKGEHGRVGRQIHRSPVISRVRSGENEPAVKRLTNASMERSKQAKGFVKYSPH